jgi:hypothetical protein
VLALLHNKTAQAVSGWIGILSLIFGAVAKVTPEWVGHLTWPQTFIVGVVSALAVSLVLAVTLLVLGAAFRYFRPVKNPQVVEEGDILVSPAYDDTKLKEDIATLAQNLDQKIVGQREEIVDILAELEQRLHLAERELQGHAALSEAMLNHLLVRYRNQIFDEIAPMIDRFDLMLDSDSSHAGHYQANNQSVLDAFSAAGVSHVGIQEASEARRNKINQDNEYVVVRESERERWADGAAKKDWHLRHLQPEILREILARGRAANRVQSERDFLKQIQAIQKANDERPARPIQQSL